MGEMWRPESAKGESRAGSETYGTREEMVIKEEKQKKSRLHHEKILNKERPIIGTEKKLHQERVWRGSCSSCSRR